MSNELTFRKNPGTETYSLVSPVRNDRPKCPDWLATRFRNYKPRYLYQGKPEVVHLEKVRWWQDTQEWVGVYGSDVYSRSTGAKWRERFVYANRDGAMVEIRQFGTKTWRAFA